MLKSKEQKRTFYDRYVKRMFDILFSIFALIILSPISMICMLAIKLEDIHSKVFFTQERNGIDGNVFKIIKFRTMKQEFNGTDIDPTVDTLTSVGRIIRRLSLDEIPQFVSILRGQMSLVGPRPLLLAYYEWFTQTELRRFNVRPGLTGLSQINGRAYLSWDERFALDTQYADNLSFLLDIKIFFRTFLVVFSHKDVIPEGGKALERFDVYRSNIQPKARVVVLKRHANRQVVSCETNKYKMRG